MTGFRGCRRVSGYQILVRDIEILVGLLLVCPDVFTEVIAAHKSLVADRTGEPLLAGVRPQVALQFVGAGEPLAAEEPVADERSLAGVPSEVRLQVRGLVVDLAAAGNVTAVLVPLPDRLARRPESVRLGAVRACADGAPRIAAAGLRGADWRNSCQIGGGQRRRQFRSGAAQHRLVEIASGGQQRRVARQVAETRIFAVIRRASGEPAAAAGHPGYVAHPTSGADPLSRM